MDRTDRHPRDNPASTVTGREAAPDSLRGSHGSARQAPPGERDAAKVTPDGRKPHDSVKSDALQESLEHGLEDTFPGSDPVSSTRRG